MDSLGWKQRLAQGIEAKGMSQREVSLASGNGPGYINSLIRDDKDATVEKLVGICKAAGLSLYFVLYGVEMDTTTEEIILELERASPHKRGALLQILRDESGS